MQKLFVKYVFVNDLRSLVDLCDFMGDIYQQNSEPPSTYYNLCQRYANISKLILKIGIFAYTFMHILFLGMLVGEAIYRRALIPPLRIYLPGVDEGTYIGVAVLILFNYVISLTGCFVFCSYDSLICVIFANMPMVASVITGHLNEMRERLLDEDCDGDEARERLTRICLKHYRYKK